MALSEIPPFGRNDWPQDGGYRVSVGGCAAHTYSPSSFRAQSSFRLKGEIQNRVPHPLNGIDFFPVFPNLFQDKPRKIGPHPCPPLTRGGMGRGLIMPHHEKVDSI